jgi:hypothetical protein
MLQKELSGASQTLVLIKTKIITPTYDPDIYDINWDL